MGKILRLMQGKINEGIGVWFVAGGDNPGGPGDGTGGTDGNPAGDATPDVDGDDGVGVDPEAVPGTGGSTTSSSWYNTGTIDIMTPEQLALLAEQIGRYGPGVAPQAGMTGKYQADQISLDQGDFKTGTIDPIMAMVNEQLATLGDRYAGQRRGSERSAANLEVIESGQQQIAQALAQQSLDVQKANQTANLSAGLKGMDVDNATQLANLQAILSQRGIDQSMLASLLGARATDPYAVVKNRGGSTGGGGIDMNTLLMAGATVLASDLRLKEDLTKIGEFADLGVYMYKWTEEARTDFGFDDTLQVGFLAQEVLCKYPDAVVVEGGVLKIDITQLNT